MSKSEKQWASLLSDLIVWAINAALLWLVWDTWVVLIFKGAPSIDYWAALVLVMVGWCVTRPRRTNTDE